MDSDRIRILRRVRKIYIYKYLDACNEVIYVGQAKDWKRRYYQHRQHDKKMMSKVYKIYIMECQDKLEMDILELYFIQYYNPKYNIKQSGYMIPSIIPVGKTWELVKGDEIKKESAINISDSQMEELLKVKSIPKELSIKIAEAIYNGKTSIWIYSMLLFEENIKFNDAMDEIERIFCF